MSQIELALLGRPEMRLDGEVVSLPAKALGLLAYLAVAVRGEALLGPVTWTQVTGLLALLSLWQLFSALRRLR